MGIVMNGKQSYLSCDLDPDMMMTRMSFSVSTLKPSGQKLQKTLVRALIMWFVDVN